ncbi:MAG TPA: hypothetical protein VNL69_08330 [Bacteroidota bacterium]|nr:hypothetical protein [Bacteroidota bacterium]
MNSKVIEFYKPFLEYIDSGKFFRTPFGVLYAVLAGFNLLIPLIVLYIAIDNQLFSMGAAFFFAFVILWVVIAGASWLGFQIWWNRRQALAGQSSSDPDFVATPVYTHFLQTAGEWCGSWVAIVGAGAGVVSGIFLRDETLEYMLPIPLISAGGFLSVVLMPVLGFLIIIVSRVIAEQVRALVAVAINTKQMKSAS